MPKNDTKPEVKGERIAKAMARAGLCSRRAAEEWIAAGRVSVNGEVLRSPARNVGPRDTIAIDGKPMPLRERTRLFLYHKSRGLVTTNADPEKRPTIFGALPRNLPRLVTVGRLDLNTEGLLLLTNDGGLARALELPQTGWLRRYRVRAHGSVTQAALDGLRAGVTVDGIHYGAIEATLDRTQGANVWLTFAMREGKNREIRNVLRHLGLHVNRLIRTSYGPFQLGELPDGAIEEVKTRVLRDQLGARVVAAAGADFSGPIVIRSEDADDFVHDLAAMDVRHAAPAPAEQRQTPSARVERKPGAEKRPAARTRVSGRAAEKPKTSPARTDERGQKRDPKSRPPRKRPAPDRGRKRRKR